MPIIHLCCICTTGWLLQNCMGGYAILRHIYTWKSRRPLSGGLWPLYWWVTLLFHSQVWPYNLIFVIEYDTNNNLYITFISGCSDPPGLEGICQLAGLNGRCLDPEIAESCKATCGSCGTSINWPSTLHICIFKKLKWDAIHQLPCICTVTGNNFLVVNSASTCDQRNNSCKCSEREDSCSSSEYCLDKSCTGTYSGNIFCIFYIWQYIFL